VHLPCSGVLEATLRLNMATGGSYRGRARSSGFDEAELQLPSAPLLSSTSSRHRQTELLRQWADQTGVGGVLPAKEPTSGRRARSSSLSEPSGRARALPPSPRSGRRFLGLLQADHIVEAAQFLHDECSSESSWLVNAFDAHERSFGGPPREIVPLCPWHPPRSPVPEVLDPSVAGTDPVREAIPLVLFSLARAYDEGSAHVSLQLHMALLRSLWLCSRRCDYELSRLSITWVIFGVACKFSDTVLATECLLFARDQLCLFAAPAEGETREQFCQRVLGTALADIRHPWNRLRHTPLFYCARSGNLALFRAFHHVCDLSPVLVEASILFREQEHGSTNPPSGISRRRRKRSTQVEPSSGDSASRRSGPRDPPCLYVAALYKRESILLFIHSDVHPACSPCALLDPSRWSNGAWEVWAALMVLGVVAFDDDATLRWLHGLSLETGVPLVHPSVLTMRDAGAAAGLEANDLPTEWKAALCWDAWGKSGDLEAFIGTVGFLNDRIGCVAAHMCVERVAHPASAPHVPSSSLPSSKPPPALRVLDCLLSMYPWLACSPVLSGEADPEIVSQHLRACSSLPLAPSGFPLVLGEWRNCLHSTCALNQLPSAHVILSRSPQASSLCGFVPSRSLCLPSGECPPPLLCPSHPLWIALGAARVSLDFDLLASLVSGYSIPALTRELAVHGPSLCTMIPEFIKSLCRRTGLSFTKLRDGTLEFARGHAHSSVTSLPDALSERLLEWRPRALPSASQRTRRASSTASHHSDAASVLVPSSSGPSHGGEAAAVANVVGVDDHDDLTGFQLGQSADHRSRANAISEGEDETAVESVVTGRVVSWRRQVSQPISSAIGSPVGSARKEGSRRHRGGSADASSDLSMLPSPSFPSLNPSVTSARSQRYASLPETQAARSYAAAVLSPTLAAAASSSVAPSPLLQPGLTQFSRGPSMDTASSSVARKRSSSLGEGELGLLLRDIADDSGSDDGDSDDLSTRAARLDTFQPSSVLDDLDPIPPEQSPEPAAALPAPSAVPAWRRPPSNRFVMSLPTVASLDDLAALGTSPVAPAVESYGEESFLSTHSEEDLLPGDDGSSEDSPVLSSETRHGLVSFSREELVKVHPTLPGLSFARGAFGRLPATVFVREAPPGGSVQAVAEQSAMEICSLGRIFATASGDPRVSFICRYFGDETRSSPPSVLVAAEPLEQSLPLVLPRLTEVRAIVLCRQLASAVACMHGCGVFHRLLRPWTVLFAGEVPKVSVFSFATLAGDRPVSSPFAASVPTGSAGSLPSVESTVRSILASLSKSSRVPVPSSHEDGVNVWRDDEPGWLPVEVLSAHLRGEKHGGGASADLFALGCLIYFILSRGAHPFDDNSCSADPTVRNERILRDHWTTDPGIRPRIAWHHTESVSIPAEVGPSPESALRPGESLVVLGAAAFRRLCACHLLRELLRPHPLARPSAADVMFHPLFWPSSLVIRLAALCSDVLRVEYGVMPGGKRQTSQDKSRFRSGRLADLPPLLRLLEGEYVRKRGTDASSWADDLERVDEAENRSWKAPEVSTKNWKGPRDYASVYAGRGLGALGILRACRNIAFAHSTEFVAARFFKSEDACHMYFLDTFPWLFLKLAEVSLGAHLLADRPPRSRGAASSMRADPSMSVSEEASRLAQRLLREGEPPKVLRTLGSAAKSIIQQNRVNLFVSPVAASATIFESEQDDLTP
jgi:serine/threonine protein kinase